MDFKDIKELIKVFDKSELNKLKVKNLDFEIALQKGFETNGTTSQVLSVPSSQVAQPVLNTHPSTPFEAPVKADSTTNDTVQSSGLETIKSPMVGTFYLSSSPGGTLFVKVGDTVNKGSTLCILEAMKIMNEVEAEYDFKLIEILVKDGSPVEYGMPLFLVEKI
jgi:acetyl-CoA carboxylase biotin carboxyl carrier protein